jgi:hypothetical protein
MKCGLAQVGPHFIRAGAMRSLVMLGFIVGLAGCGTSRLVEQSDADPAPFNLNDALAECRNGYPDQLTQAVARAACMIKGTDQLRPLLPFPELLDQENALRKSLAEQVQSGSISLLERNRQVTKFHAKILAEEQGRLQARAADAKSAAAKSAAADPAAAESAEARPAEAKPAEAKPVDTKPAETVNASLAARQWRLSNPDGCTSLGGNTANCY